MKSSLRALIALTSAVIAFGSAFALSDGPRSMSTVCRATAFAGEPIAVISPLPTYVSNGTPYPLNGADSSDTDGTIMSYSWNITVNGASEYFTGVSITYTFAILSVYTIELTVTDNESKIDTDVKSVSAVSDADDDGLPDWWEQKYFGNLAQGPNGDYDSDGYSNLEEYEDGTNPTVKNAGPGVLSKIPIWGYMAIVAGVLVVVLLLMWPRIRKRRKEKEQKKIQYALEIEKALEEDK